MYVGLPALMANSSQLPSPTSASPAAPPASLAQLLLKTVPTPTAQSTTSTSTTLVSAPAPRATTLTPPLGSASSAHRAVRLATDRGWQLVPSAVLPVETSTTSG